ncbi:MAG: hypothetical protein IJT84_05210 [Clostridia bacterium]|nr:hypothetical protein [Clostridia bacterium]
MTYEEVKKMVSECRFNITSEFHEECMEKVITALEKQIPKKPKMDNDNGIYEVEVCPYCMRRLFPNDHHCKCGQAIDWSE